MKYAVVTFGCRVNQADSLELEGALRARGATAAPASAADVVVVNTCSVTGAADQGARQTIRKVARENPSARIVVTGCYATRRPDDVSTLPGVLHVVPNPDKDTLVDLLPWPAGSTTATRYAGGVGPCGSSVEPGVAGRTAFTLRVQTGCDETCSYCVIPTTRGPGRSKPLVWVESALSMAIAAGYREITICGVHLGAYGRDGDEGTSLLTLVQRLTSRRDDVMFRLSSLEPMDCSMALIDLVASSPRLAPYFHLPLQHGDADMLTAMRRPYSPTYYRDLIGDIARRMPGACIGTDVIAGFPGETERQAEALAAFLDSLPLGYVHVFPYSDRPGTEASAMPPKVSGETIRARAARLRAVAATVADRFARSQVGSTRRGLVVDDGQSVVTDNYLKLRLDRHLPRNSWADVRVESPRAGRVVELGRSM
jgi:threonylcarbamoyladenosine tRNA methylthiotransferase MtaB